MNNNYNGMYKSAELISVEMQEYVSPYTMRHLSNIKNWKRHVNKNSPIYKGVIAGTVPAAYYKHLIFPGRNSKSKINMMKN